MNDKIKENNNIISLYLTEFVRISDTIKWSIISFLGFILGLTILSLKIYLLPFLVFIVTTFCIMAFTFAINNFYDDKSDKINPRRKNINAIATGGISKKTALFFLILLAIIPLIISILFRLDVFLFCAFLLFLGWAYSAPPLRIKNIPVIDVLWHFLGFFSYIIWGSLVAGSIGLITYLMALSIGIFSSIGQVGNHISDYNSDKETGTITFAVWSGLDNAKKTINLLTFFHVVVIILLFLFYSIKYYASIIFLIVIAILGLVILKPKRGVFPSKNCWTFYFAIVIGGGVYISILIYHIYTLIGVLPLEILKFSII